MVTITELNELKSILKSDNIKNMLSLFIQKCENDIINKNDNRSNIKSFISYFNKTTKKLNDILKKSYYLDNSQIITNSYFALKLNKDDYITTIEAHKPSEKILAFEGVNRIIENNNNGNIKINKNTLINYCKLYKYIKIVFDENITILFDSELLKNVLYVFNNNILTFNYSIISNTRPLKIIDEKSGSSGVILGMRYTNDENITTINIKDIEA